MQVDATQNSASAQRFGVKGYPTVVLAKGGMKYAFSGSRTLGELTAFAQVRGRVESLEWHGPSPQTLTALCHTERRHEGHR